jgi:hypothetical protein
MANYKNIRLFLDMQGNDKEAHFTPDAESFVAYIGENMNVGAHGFPYSQVKKGSEELLNSMSDAELAEFVNANAARLFFVHNQNYYTVGRKGDMRDMFETLEVHGKYFDDWVIESKDVDNVSKMLALNFVSKGHPYAKISRMRDLGQVFNGKNGFQFYDEHDASLSEQFYAAMREVLSHEKFPYANGSMADFLIKHNLKLGILTEDIKNNLGDVKLRANGNLDAFLNRIQNSPVYKKDADWIIKNLQNITDAEREIVAKYGYVLDKSYPVDDKKARKNNFNMLKKGGVKKIIKEHSDDFTNEFYALNNLEDADLGKIVFGNGANSDISFAGLLPQRLPDVLRIISRLPYARQNGVANYAIQESLKSTQPEHAYTRYSYHNKNYEGLSGYPVYTLYSEILKTFKPDATTSKLFAEKFAEYGKQQSHWAAESRTKAIEGAKQLEQLNKEMREYTKALTDYQNSMGCADRLIGALNAALIAFLGEKTARPIVEEIKRGLYDKTPDLKIPELPKKPLLLKKAEWEKLAAAVSEWEKFANDNNLQSKSAVNEIERNIKNTRNKIYDLQKKITETENEKMRNENLAKDFEPRAYKQALIHNKVNEDATQNNKEVYVDALKKIKTMKTDGKSHIEKDSKGRARVEKALRDYLRSQLQNK